ncbi:biotin/lipoyl-containing protein, partial [Brevibacterium epidermidis]
MSFEFPLPDVGEGLTEADIVAWKVAPGDNVTVNQILVEIETAKSLVELPSPQAGTVGALLVEEGQTIEVGTPIIRFGGDDSSAEAAPASAGAPASNSEENPADESGEADGGATLVGYGAKETSSKRRPRKGASVPAPAAAAAPAAPAAEATPPAPAAAPATPAQPASAPASPSKPLAKPPVRKLAKDLGVELSQVTPTGPRGDVTRDDVHAAANQTTAPTAGA